ncbi:MAG: glycosyltransferase family 2 protein [Candidatus Tumulicola sp.]
MASVVALRPGVDRQKNGSLPRVVAVVLNWNAWSDTIACVESLLASSQVPYQIVICDNGSVDDSVARILEWAKTRDGFVSYENPEAALDGPALYSPLALIALPKNGGYAYGNNIGIRYAIDRSNAEYVWILNNDTVAERDALERMVEVAESNPSVGIVGSKLLRYDAPDTIQAMGGGYIIPVLCHDTQLSSGRSAATVEAAPIPLDHIVGASLLVRAEAVYGVGLIDESYFLYREETDWCIRMRRAGWKLYCCSQAIVWHKQSHSIGFKSPLHDYYAVRNMLRLVWKFYPISAPTAFGYFALRSVAPKLLRLEFMRLLAVVHAFCDFFSGVSGRCVHHSDQMLLRSYVSGEVRPVPWWPSLKSAKSAGIAVAFLIAAVVLQSGVISPMGAPLHHPVAARKLAHPAPHAHAARAVTRIDARTQARLASTVGLR